MRVLLTGASGNFGQSFIRQSNIEVIQLNRDGWDQLSEKLGAGIDMVIHAAGDLRTHVTESPARLMDSNLLATARLLEAARCHQISRFVFLSSCAVYGEDMRTGEESPCFPISLNGMCKLLNEKMIIEFCSAHKIKYEIFRIFNMYGGDDHFSVISYMRRAIEGGMPFVLNNNGIAQRDFIHVADVAKIILQLLQKDIPYTHLNIGTGIATKLSDIIGLVHERFPKMCIRHAQVKEAEYSRANISRLLEFVDVDFIRIENYLRNEFMR